MSSNLKKIQAEAKFLRKENPRKYGVKGTKKGDNGYVYRGWQMAIRDATNNLEGAGEIAHSRGSEKEQRSRSKSNQLKREISSVPEAAACRRSYKIQASRLKADYHAALRDVAGINVLSKKDKKILKSWEKNPEKYEKTVIDHYNPVSRQVEKGYPPRVPKESKVGKKRGPKKSSRSYEDDSYF